VVSSFRPFIVALLCSVLAGGNVVAWIHVATCDDVACVENVGLSEKASANSHCSCCHHCSAKIDHQPVEDFAASVPEPVSDGTSHDSGDCPICQSLVCSTSGTVDFDEIECELIAVAVACTVTVHPFIAKAFSVAKPRGPPSLSHS
jgi:hypothetical protein